MLKEFIYKILSEKRDRKRHEVMKLNWKKAELERLLDQKKKEKEYGEH